MNDRNRMIKPNGQQPPRWAKRLLYGFCSPELVEELEGDLEELFYERVPLIGVRKARLRYVRDVFSLMKPFAIKRKPSRYPTPATTDMLRNYLKIAFRNLAKNKVYSFINIAGLATGMVVAMLIGLWIYDELSHDKYHQNYDRIAQVMQHQTYNGDIGTQVSVPFPMGAELKKSYGSDFKYVMMASWTSRHILTVGEKTFSKTGLFIEPQAPDMLTLKMLRGNRAGLNDPASILLSESVARAFFGETDPMGQVMKLDNDQAVKVTGVYEDLPANSSFNEMTFVAPWELHLIKEPWIKQMDNPWRCNCFQTFVQLADHVDIDKVSAKIKNIKVDNIRKDELRYKPAVFLNPMSQWHLYSEFKNGIRTGGRIEFVWLFGLIGSFVLLLACINFMNLSTARSEKRAKEVGIRKAVGSVRAQLIGQFFSESLLVVAFGFLLALALVHLVLPLFNEVAAKQISMPWDQPLFWLLGLGFSLFTGLIAGSYPALYLSSFQPVKVLKGTFRVGRFATIPRKVLVVVQFTVSITLIIGTIIVFRQIQFAKNRPIGYTRNGLVTVEMLSPGFHKQFNVVRDELKKSGTVVEMAKSGSPTTEIWSTNGGFEWKGKDPNLSVDFPNVEVSHDYGKTIGWQFVAGRDFSPAFSTDSSAFIINQTAAKYIGFKNPIGEIIRWDGRPYKIIGVIKDMVVQSPYAPISPSIFHLYKDQSGLVTLKINPVMSASQALTKIEAVFKKYNPGVPFEYKFVDQEYAAKFAAEERIGTLAGIFAGLAILISCLGLFGLASFMAEQRVKEIGVRKVLGASVFNLWGLLSQNFVILVAISFAIATPTAYYLLNNWLENYQYRTDISWWVFAVAGLSALLITLLTVSYQAIKAAMLDPVKSLRTE
ncbi:ABC transporter permease [Larkinella rosea]|nr:ABC transporter permease [Larkinella rosea]